MVEGFEAMARKKTTCIVPHCPRKLHRRGLCGACYRSALRMIAAGEVTELQLMQRGLMLPKKGQKSPLRTAVNK